MKPTYEEMLLGSTRWRGKAAKIDYETCFHGYREPGPEHDGHPGIWTYYLIVPQQMYPHRWGEFKCVRKDNGFQQNGPAFDAIEFYGGITWASSEPYWDRKTKRQWDASKVGCDYCHLWDSERGYPHDYGWVRRDAENACRAFAKAHPDMNLRCDWSGVWGQSEEFYTARNGRLVHRDAVIPDEYDGWREGAA
ncbi:MAG: hypothetical protein AAF661_05165 [Pseudomonadota bacterium]